MIFLTLYSSLLSSLVAFMPSLYPLDLFSPCCSHLLSSSQ